jgi:hypothetical protein
VFGSTAGPYFSLTHAGEANGRNYLIGSSGSGNAPGIGCFEIYDGNAGLSRLVITAAGNIGIGLLSPGYPLDVNGTARTTGLLTGTMLFGGSINNSANQPRVDQDGAYYAN